jgi:hypothetical protein
MDNTWLRVERNPARARIRIYQCEYEKSKWFSAESESKKKRKTDHAMEKEGMDDWEEEKQ